MYELTKIGKLFTSKFVGTWPSSYKKRIYRAAVSQSLRNTALNYYKAYYSVSVSTALSLDVAEDSLTLSDKPTVFGETTNERMHVEFRIPTSRSLDHGSSSRIIWSQFMGGFIECALRIYLNHIYAYFFAINHGFFPYNTELSFYLNLTHFSPAHPTRYRNNKQATC